MPKPWYEAAFGADYLERYAHRDKEEALRTVELLWPVTKPKSDSRVLDLCCGAGRHVLALHQKGLPVVGLDLSADLLDAGLDAFRQNTECFDGKGRNKRCPLFVRGDKRILPFSNAAFDIVTHFFTAFGYFEEDAENFAVFNEVARVLVPCGWYLFDFLSAEAVLREFNGREEIHSSEDFKDGTRVDSTKRLTPGQRRVEKKMRFFHDGKLQREITESVRLFTPEELRPALANAGLLIQHEWGDYRASAYDPAKSQRWIALSRKGRQATG